MYNNLYIPCLVNIIFFLSSANTLKLCISVSVHIKPSLIIYDLMNHNTITLQSLNYNMII